MQPVCACTQHPSLICLTNLSYDYAILNITLYGLQPVVRLKVDLEIRDLPLSTSVRNGRVTSPNRRNLHLKAPKAPPRMSMRLPIRRLLYSGVACSTEKNKRFKRREKKEGEKEEISFRTAGDFANTRKFRNDICAVYLLL